MAFLTPAERQTLTAIVDTLAPALEPPPGGPAQFFQTGGVALGIPVLIEQALEEAADDQTRSDIRQVLKLLGLPPVNWAMARRWGRFSALDLEARTAILGAWATSRANLARGAFQAFKRLTLFLFYAHMPGGQSNPLWPALNYRAMGPQSEAPHEITPLIPDGPLNLSADVVIVGSGAGGGVVAGELAAAGYQVVVIEKGGHYEARDFIGDELKGNQTLYEKAALLTTTDLSMTILAGSTLGGGTTVNWSASLRPPDYVLKEWEGEYGFSGAAGPDYQASLDAVSRRMNISTAESGANAQNAALERGCQALGYEVGVIPRNVQGCEDCGYCGYGCPFGAKQGTLKTYLKDAYQQGAQILVRAQAEKVTQAAGRATGIEGTIQGRDGQSYPLRIRAKAVVVAAGSLHTPALLLRSGLRNPHIGANLRLHPVTSVTGEYEQPIRSWQGPPMTRIYKGGENLDGRGYGYRLETPPVHPGTLGAAFPWQSGQQHRELMQNIEHNAYFIVLVRDYYSGRVKLDKTGYPAVEYQVHPYDAAHMMQGVIEGLKIHRAAGARRLYTAHGRLMQHYVNGAAGFEDFLGQVRGEGFRPNSYALFSAHQMGSCRVGGSASQGALRPTGETYEVGGLFVADASVFPTASGVNPMLTTLGTAHFIAQHVKASLV
jgi:choline dehydrogenase-like flavoprotein